jgi:hypothetical protein
MSDPVVIDGEIASTRTAVSRGPAGSPVAGTGRDIAPIGNYNGIPVLTVKVIDYAGKSRDEAAADVWRVWTARYPGALIQVVHGDAWDVVL